MEVVVRVAGKWCDLVIFWIFDLANGTLLHRLKRLSVELFVHETLDHLGYLLFLWLLVLRLLSEVGTKLWVQTWSTADDCQSEKSETGSKCNWEYHESEEIDKVKQIPSMQTFCATEVPPHWLYCEEPSAVPENSDKELKDQQVNGALCKEFLKRLTIHPSARNLKHYKVNHCRCRD